MGCEGCGKRRRGLDATPPPIIVNVRRGSISPVTAYLVGLVLGFTMGRVLPPLKDVV